jgi:DNA-binding IclR family transcriptional regulator
MLGAMAAGDERYRIELVEKTFAVLEAFTPAEPELSIPDIVARTGLSPSSVYRLVRNLVRLEIVEPCRPDGRTFKIAAKLYRLGSLAIVDLRRIAYPRLEELRERFDYTANLIVRDGDAALLVEVVESARPFRMAASIGSRDPLHCTAAGKCLLAFLPPEAREAMLDRIELTQHTPTTLTARSALEAELGRVARRGFAIDDGEYEGHARCVGVPVVDRLGRVTAAISLSGTQSLLDEPGFDAIVQAMRDAARDCSHDAGAPVGSYPESSAREGAGEEQA